MDLYMVPDTLDGYMDAINMSWPLEHLELFFSRENNSARCSTYISNRTSHCWAGPGIPHRAGRQVGARAASRQEVVEAVSLRVNPEVSAYGGDVGYD